MEWLMEQIAAAKDIIHLYKCFHCQMATAVTPVIVIQNVPPQGSRVRIVGVCDTRRKEDND